MPTLEIIDSLFHIENIIGDLSHNYAKKADGLEHDVRYVVSTVQELRFTLESELGT